MQRSLVFFKDYSCRLAQNDLLSPDEASSGLLKLDFRFEMC